MTAWLAYLCLQSIYFEIMLSLENFTAHSKVNESEKTKSFSTMRLALISDRASQDERWGKWDAQGIKFKAALIAHEKMLNIILAIRKIQIKITVRSHSTSTGMARIKKTDNNNYWQGCRKIETQNSYTYC